MGVLFELVHECRVPSRQPSSGFGLCRVTVGSQFLVKYRATCAFGVCRDRCHSLPVSLSWSRRIAILTHFYCSGLLRHTEAGYVEPLFVLFGTQKVVHTHIHNFENSFSSSSFEVYLQRSVPPLPSLSSYN